MQAATGKFVKWEEEKEQREAFLQKQNVNKKPIPENHFSDFYEKSLIESTLAPFGFKESVNVREKETKKKEAEMYEHFEQFVQKQRYIPKGKEKSWRLRLCKDLSEGSEVFPVPVFCDVDTASSDVIFTEDFKYIVKNKFKDKKLLEKGENLIQKCDCAGPCKAGKCSCIELHTLVNQKNPVLLQADGRVKATLASSDMYSYVLILCGDKCGCPTNCPNRLENLQSKNRFEIFRRNLDLGFGVRTLTAVKLGEVVMEFTGRVIKEKDLFLPKIEGKDDLRRLDYAFELYDMDQFEDLQRSIEKFTENRISQKVWKENIGNLKKLFVDPYSFGNVTRFLSSSCLPNLAPIRVIANYLHPSRHHIFMVAVAPIAAGTELTIDYGEAYRNRMNYNCLCNAPLCSNGPMRNIQRKIPVKQVSDGIFTLYKNWAKNSKENDEEFNTIVLDDDDFFDWEAYRLFEEVDIEREPKALRKRGELYKKYPVMDNDTSRTLTRKPLKRKNDSGYFDEDDEQSSKRSCRSRSGSPGNNKENNYETEDVIILD